MNVPLIAGYVVAILAEIGLPIAAGFWAESNLDVRWRSFAYGALVFGIAQLAFRIPLVSWIARTIDIAHLTSPTALGTWWFFLAASTAVFEEGGRYLGYRILFKDIKRNWNNAVMYGLGHGGLESIFIVGLPTIIALINAIMIPGLDPKALGLDSQQTQELLAAKEQLVSLHYWMPLAAALERSLTLAFQIALSLLVVQVPLRAEWRWLGYAAGLHFFVELLVPTVATYVNIALAEVILASFASGALYWVWQMRPAQPVKRTRS